MPLSSLHKFLCALLLLATGLSGFWFGEGFVPLVSTPALLVFIALPLAAAALAPNRNRPQVRMTLLAAGLLFIGGWSAGQSTAGKAFDACLRQGEEVRQALADYRLQHGQFPARLAELAIELPGRRLLHPTLWSYQPREGDYRLSFSNGTVRHVANARYPFVVPETSEAPEETSLFNSPAP